MRDPPKRHRDLSAARPLGAVKSIRHPISRKCARVTQWAAPLPLSHPPPPNARHLITTGPRFAGQFGVEDVTGDLREVPVSVDAHGQEQTHDQPHPLCRWSPGVPAGCR